MQNSIPIFEKAKMNHQKARASELHPDYWYPVVKEHVVAKPGKIHEIKFNGKSIAIFRTKSGELSAIENRCAHRQMALSKGCVDQEKIVCPYHGWSYDTSGQCVQVHHDLFDKPFPKVSLKVYPLKSAHGFIWLFPGDSNKAGQIKIPELFPQKNAKDWVACDLEFRIKAHFSIVMENSADLTHVWLHRKFMPVGEGENVKVLTCESDNERVIAQHTVGDLASKGFAGFLFNRKKAFKTELHADAVFDYPYLHVTYASKARIIYIPVPIDSRTTHLVTFFCLDTKNATIPELSSFNWSKHLMRYVIAPLVNFLYVKPIFKQDVWICGEEQICYESHFNRPVIDLNPFTRALQKLIIYKTELIKKIE